MPQMRQRTISRSQIARAGTALRGNFMLRTISLEV